MKNRMYDIHNFQELFQICHETAMCFEHSLYLEVPFSEFAFSASDSVNHQSSSTRFLVDNSVRETFKYCYSTLAENLAFFGPQNQPKYFSHRPTFDKIQKLGIINHYNTISNNKAPINNQLIDPFWYCIHSQCIMSAYDTITQLLADEYISASMISQIASDESISPAGVHEIYKKAKQFDLPVKKTNTSTTLTNKIDTQLRDRLCNIYSGLLKETEISSEVSDKRLDALKISILACDPITFDNNKHTLFTPSTNLIRYFGFSSSAHPKIQFNFTLEGPEEGAFPSDAPIVNQETTDLNQTTKLTTWECDYLCPNVFPKAGTPGEYHITLEISVLYSRANLDLSFKLKAQSTISPNDKDNKQTTKKNQKRGTYHTITAIDFFPTNIFIPHAEKPFSLSGLDFYAHFALKSPNNIKKITRLLCMYSPESSHQSLPLSNTPSDKIKNSDVRFNYSTDDIDKMYTLYREEKMLGLQLTRDIYDALQKLLEIGVKLSDEEFHTLCQLGGANNVFSRSFLLYYALHPLFSEKGFGGSALDQHPIKNDYYAVSFSTKPVFSFDRSVWLDYVKKYISYWNKYLMPSCEWFFLLSLFHSYGINFHSHDHDESILRQKLSELYHGLCSYIGNYHNVILSPANFTLCSNGISSPNKQVTDSNNKKIKGNVARNKSPYTETEIFCSLASNNRHNAINISQNQENPVLLNSLSYFNKDTLIACDKENNRITNDKLIRQTYIQFLFEH